MNSMLDDLIDELDDAMGEDDHGTNYVIKKSQPG